MRNHAAEAAYQTHIQLTCLDIHRNHYAGKGAAQVPIQGDKEPWNIKAFALRSHQFAPKGRQAAPLIILYRCDTIIPVVTMTSRLAPSRAGGIFFSAAHARPQAAPGAPN